MYAQHYKRMLNVATISIDNMNNSDAGGVGAKKGFLYQDYIAALYVTKMLRDKRIKGICCEVKDDIDILYEEYVQYLQIKTTDSEKKWNALELCKRTKKDGSTRYNNDSILHKSLDCDSSKIHQGKFGIVSTRDVDSKLQYLKVDFEKRLDKLTARQKLVSTLSSYIKSYKSPNGNGVDYWINNCQWYFYQDKDYVKLLCITNIRNAANDIGIFLDSNKADEKILNAILVKVTELSALSKKEHMGENKTYFREELIEWFQNELENIGSNGTKKIYSRNTGKLPNILNVLHSSLSDTSLSSVNGIGYYQSYDRNSYRFKFISSNIIKWIPEIYLRPDELSGTYSANLISTVNRLLCTVLSDVTHDKNLVPRVLLHSLIRFYSKSQPIPAHLYIEKKGNLIEFDNIHIVVKENSPDDMWFGLSYWDDGSSFVDTFINKVISFVDILYDDQRKIILDIKSDDYLIKHDVDIILDASKSISEHLSRLFFVLFVGYKSREQTLAVQKNYEDRLKIEVEHKFNLIVHEINKRHGDLVDLNFIVYVYPIPCIDTLVNIFKDTIGGNNND